ncbi:MAG: polysaccharide export protein [Desulfovibrionaceae bacterium]|nr:polysaccharide export protein [Desulfovibrionaceae bacterium]
MPFGANLFTGHFTEKTSQTLQRGDQLIVRIWGSQTLDAVVAVDADGQIDLGRWGKITVAGLPADPKDALEKAVRSKLDAAGAGEVQLYVRPLDAQGISVFVTGYVRQPGKYTGLSQDSTLAFLDRAGGIDARGSYRNIRIVRQDKEACAIDLYPFITRGFLPKWKFRDGDTIVVSEKGAVIAASGKILNEALFEFCESVSGRDLAALADPEPAVTHVSLSGTRNGAPYEQYLTLEDFQGVLLGNGDRVRFLADRPGDTITVEIRGAIRGQSVFPVRKETRLRELCRYIAVDPSRADVNGLYVMRKSVAVRQKKAIEDALRRLEHNVHTAPSASADEAQIRAREAEMITGFISRAKEVQPEGIVVVSENGNLADIALEQGDIVVVPEKTDVVLISGEVMVPQAVVWSREKQIEDYIRLAGGFTARAERSSLLVVRPSGELIPDADQVEAGDQILVLPKVESKSFQAVKDITQILYQIAVACKVILPI